jgi:glycosyltransferase involved in cell wall biosynthesis
VRRVARSSAATSIWSTAPLTFSLFNRFCLSRAHEFHGDLIHAHFGTTGVMALPFIRATGLPAVVTFYGVDGSASLRIQRWRENFAEMFERVARVIVLCDAVRDRLLAIGCPSGKLVVWNLPAGIEQYPYQTRSTSGGPVRFLIAARFVEKKGHKYLVDALDRVVRAGVDARLTMIGYGPFKPAIEADVQRRSLTERVTIVDTQLASSFSDTYREALAAHDIFVLPSTTGVNGDDEGGPALTMVCAQAAGLPAISTPFAGAERSMIDGVTGWLCRQDDAGSLAEKMQWAATHPEVWNTVGKAAGDHVRAQFSLDGQMARLLALYRDVIDETHGA